MGVVNGATSVYGKTNSVANLQSLSSVLVRANMVTQPDPNNIDYSMVSQWGGYTEIINGVTLL